MIDQTYQRYLSLTSDPAAAALLTLAAVIDGKPERVALTVKEAAASIGVSVDAVYDLCASGRLRHQRIGRAIRIPPDSLEDIKQERGGSHKFRCLRNVA